MPPRSRNLFCVPVAVFLGLLCLSPSCLSSGDATFVLPALSEPIVLDGLFDDWPSPGSAFADKSGDSGPSGIDFGNLWVVNDPYALYFRLELGRETIWQNGADDEAGHDIRIFFDVDGDGFAAAGTDLEIRPGEKAAAWLHGGAVEPASLNDLGMQSAPTHSSATFEFRIALDTPIGAGSRDRTLNDLKLLRFFFIDGQSGDRIPDQGILLYPLVRSLVPPVQPISIARSAPQTIRLLSHNVYKSAPARDKAPFERYLRALQPDVVAFQELTQWGTEEVSRLVRESVGNGDWFTAQNRDCVTSSRWPIRYSAAIEGNLLCLIDLPDSLSNGDLVVFNAHTPCCGNNAGRDYEHDSLSATWRDLIAGQGPFPLTPHDVMAMAGDFNMVGFERQLKTLLEGEIIDPIRFGPQFRPSRLLGSLVNVPLRHTHTRETYTWSNPRDAFTPGKLDYLLIDPARAEAVSGFILNTPDMPVAVLAAAGLLKDDSAVSDHLVLIADLRTRTSTVR